MNSYNHYALGAVAGFLFRRVAGIEPAAPGFREILVKPVLDPRVTKAGADYDSVLGRISTDWCWTPGERFELTLTVPPGATARVELPDTLGAVSVDGTPTEGDIRLGSGRRQITARP
jgi:alpha-L-rhamnosidase